LINLFHTPFWWTTKIAISKSTQISISLNQTSATFETKKWHLFQKKNVCQSPNLQKKLRLSSGVMSLTAPKKKIKDRRDDASPGDGNSPMGIFKK